MSQVRKLQLYYKISISMLIIFSVTFLIMPITNRISTKNVRGALTLIGVVFWLSCISGYVFLFLSYRLLHKIGEVKKRKRKIYLYSNLPTTVADTCCIAGLVVLVVLLGRGLSGQYVIYIDLFIIALTFNMHLLLSRDLNKRIKTKAKNDKEEK